MYDYFQSLIAHCAAEWRPVAGHGGRYEVSSDGNVRSLAHMQRHSDGKSLRRRGGRVLTPGYRKSKHQYGSVNLCGGTRKSPARAVHELVAEAFIGPRPTTGAVFVDHINGRCDDNRLSNLRYITPSDNVSKQAGRAYLGVSRSNGSWYARLHKNGVTHYLGCYRTKDIALIARLAKEKELLGGMSPIRN